MTSAKFALAMILISWPSAAADEIAYGDIDANGKLETRGLTAIETARGADSFFLDDPMDSHDYVHVSTVRKSLFTQIKASSNSSSKVASLAEALRPIFTAMPKDSNGRLSRGTARYALHRFFSERHGWTIKGMQPAGAAWMTSMSVDDDVLDLSKYTVPTYLQGALLKELGASGFDLHSLAILAATLEHLIHAEMINLLYSVYTTLKLPIPGKKSGQQVDDIIDTFMMTYAFGLNLDLSDLDDVTSAKLHLDNTHAGWPALRAFAQEIKRSVFATGELGFDEILQLVEQIGEKYVKWQAEDCGHVNAALVTKPSYSNGAVNLSEASLVSWSGRRELLTESKEELQNLGTLREMPGTEAQLIIANYINSQSMCLSTASFYTACCINECEGLLAKLESEVLAPMATPEKLVESTKKLSMTLKRPAETLVNELNGLKDQATGLVSIHSRAFAQWMHDLFPLQCPAPDATHGQKVTNPKTPDEWIGEGDLLLAELVEMTEQISRTLAQYTSMGKMPVQTPESSELVSDPNLDVVTIRPKVKKQTQQSLIHSAIRLVALISMLIFSVTIIKSGFSQLHCSQANGKKGRQVMYSKDFA